MSMRDEPLDRRRERFLRDFFENSELYTFGIITQKGYKDLEDRLTAHAAEVQRRFHRWFIITLSAFAIIALSSTVGLIGFGVVLGKQGKTTDERRVDMTANTRAGCERNKLDRSDVAAFQRAQTTYITSVTGAASVHEDVKRAARKAILTFDRTSKGLTARSKIDCKKAFPDPTLFP
jgi:hypothetical protein